MIPDAYSENKEYYDNLALDVTSEKFLSNYENYLNIVKNEALERSCTSFIYDNYENFFNSTDLKNDENEFQLKVTEYCTFIVNFTETVTPNSLSLEQKEFIANFMLWTYIYDDALTSLIDKMNSNSLGKIAGRGLVKNLNNHAFNSWKAGLTGNKNYTRNSLLSDKYASFKDLAAISFSFGEQLSILITEETSPLIELVSIEFLSFLNGLTEQFSGAPETESSYFQRHRKTGGIKLFFNINFLFLANNMDSSFNIKKNICQILLDPFITNYYSAGENCIIYSNDASGAKDIGGDDESLLAIYIGKRIKNLRLSTARDHGQVLAKYLATENGFQSMLELNKNLRASFLAFNTRLENIREQSLDLATKTSLAEAVVPWVYGYHLFSPQSSRYGAAFKAYMIALTGDFDSYQSYLKKFRG